MLYFFKKLTVNPTEVGALFIIAFMSFFILANFFAGFVWPLYLLAMGVGFFISVFYPKSGMLSVIFLTMIFERFFTLQSVFLGKSEYKIYPLDIILIGVFAGIIFQLYKSGSLNFIFRKKFPQEYYALITFIFLNIVYFLASVQALGADWAVSFSTFKNYAFYSLLYFAMIALIRKKKDVEEIARFFLMGAVGIIAFIFLGLVRGEGLWSEYTPLSTSGVRTLAFTHGLYATFALVAVFLYRIFSLNKKSSMSILLAIWTIGIVGTMMRHLWIGVGVVLGMAYLFLQPEWKKSYRRKIFQATGLTLAGIVLIGYIIVLFPHSRLAYLTESAGKSLVERVYSLENLNQDESYSWRSLVWNSAWEKYKKHFILGIGTGHKVSIENGGYHDFVEIKNIHNSYLSILVQFGIFGAGVFLCFVGMSLRSLIKSFSNKMHIEYKFAVFGIVGVYLLGFAFQPYLETNLLGIFFWMSLGAGKAIENLE